MYFQLDLLGCVDSLFFIYDTRPSFSQTKYSIERKMSMYARLL